MVFRVCASKSQADWPGNNGYPGKLDAWFRERPTHTTESQNSQAVYDLVLKFGVSGTIVGKICFFWKASESRV